MAISTARTPTLADAIRKLLEDRLADVHTCLPGRITKYDSAKQIADIEVCVKKRTLTDDGDVIVESFPVIPNVPVDIAQTTNFFMSFPVSAGDFVWLHVVEQSLDKWLHQGSESLGSPSGPGIEDPIERRFNLKDCFATLARNPTSAIAETETDCVVIGGRASAPRVYLTSSIIGLGAKAPTSFAAKADSVQARLDALAAAISGWTPVPNDGGAALKAALASWLAGSNNVAATKVKIV